MHTQVAEENYILKADSCVPKLTKIIRMVLESPACGILQKKLDMNTIQLRIYSDGSYYNNRDLTSQLGYITFASFIYDACSPISYRSYKRRRVVRSVLRGETFAFVATFDQDFPIKEILEKAYTCPIAMRMLTE